MNDVRLISQDNFLHNWLKIHFVRNIILFVNIGIIWWRLYYFLRLHGNNCFTFVSDLKLPNQKKYKFCMIFYDSTPLFSGWMKKLKQGDAIMPPHSYLQLRFSVYCSLFPPVLRLHFTIQCCMCTVDLRTRKAFRPAAHVYK